MIEGYQVKAFRVKHPGTRWYEDYVGRYFPYFIAETNEEQIKVMGMMDNFPRYWILSKDVPSSRQWRRLEPKRKCLLDPCCQPAAIIAEQAVSRRFRLTELSGGD